MEKTLVQGGRVYVDGAFEKIDLLCADGRIVDMKRQWDGWDGKRIDAQDRYVIPGFIDAHTHGAVGVDVNAATEADLQKVAAFFATQGTTAFCASILTDTDQQTMHCLEAIQAVMKDHGQGACLIGAHLEGPFLAKQYKGAMPESLLREASVEWLESYLQKYPKVIRYITLSPEVPGACALIDRFANELAIAIGHSGATYEEAVLALEKGARCCTHTFNAMGLFHQHAPSIMGAVLEKDCFCEMICDGRHLHPGAVRMLLACKGMDRAFAVTDSIMATGFPDGAYRLGVNAIVVEKGDAKLADTGVRAGSTLTMHQALLNLLAFTQKPLEDILPLLTSNPASALRLDQHKGRIQVDMDADLVLLDEALNVTLTMVEGAVAYDLSFKGIV